MISPLLFVTCFMFIVSLLLIGVIYSRVHWLAKAGLVVASLLFSVLFYRGYVDSLGFPTEIQPIGVFRFVYGVVHEPVKIDNDPGAVFLWIMMDGWRQPRAIALPYTKENRKTIGLAKKRVEGGQSVYMQFGQKSGDQAGDKGDGTGGGADQNKSSSGSNTVPYEIHGKETLLFKAPPDTVPKKEFNHD